MKLRAVIELKGLGQTTSFSQLRQNANDALAGEREVNLNPDTFAREVVDNRKQPELAAITQDVMNEIERPTLIRKGHRADGISSNVSNAALPISGLAIAALDCGRVDTRACD